MMFHVGAAVADNVRAARGDDVDAAVGDIAAVGEDVCAFVGKEIDGVMGGGDASAAVDYDVTSVGDDRSCCRGRWR